MGLSLEEFYAMLDELAAYFSDNLKSNTGSEKILDVLIFFLPTNGNGIFRYCYTKRVSH